jgi:hypothetical protein
MIGRKEIDMKLCCAALLVASTLSAVSTAADDHLVSPEAARAALARAADDRDRDLATIGRALSTPAADRAAERVGVDLDRLRAGLPALTDDEARDLAARTEALDVDPAAGLLGTVVDLLVIVVLVLLVLLLLDKND